MQFIGRKRELNYLEEAWHKEEAFVMVSGRRHVGKTALVREFLKMKNALFFSASNTSDKMNRIRFERAMKEHFGKGQDAEIKDVASWKDYFKLFAEQPEKGGKVLVLDNFDQLVTANHDMLKILRSAWIQSLEPNGVMLVVILPDSAVLTSVFQNKAFMNCISRRIDLQAVSFVEMMKEYPHNDFNQLMLLYSTAGGVPLYWNAFLNCVDDRDFKSAIEENFLDLHGEFFFTAPYLINQDVWEPSQYHAILASLALGDDTLDDISLTTGYKTAMIEERLSNLIILGYVSKDTSVVENRLFGRKTVLYRISDPFLSFWYTFVYPYFDEIQQGRTANARKNLTTNFAKYIQYWFRRVATEIFITASKQGTIPIKCKEVGEYFNRREDQVNILGIDAEEKKLFLGDCVYSNQPYTKKQFDEFVEKCEDIKELRKTFKNYEWIYGIFSAYPFEEELLDYALITENVLLFNGITVYSLNS